MDFNILYEDGDVLVVDKPAGIVVFAEGNPSSGSGPFLINELIKSRPELKSAGEAPRYGIVHRLDKDTSGVLLVAKTTEALIFLQKQFKNREVEKKYTALATGTVKEDSGVIETLIGRSPQDPRKQKAYSMDENAPPSAREAITEFKILQKFQKYTLLEIVMKTGRKHQIRCHMAYVHHPIAGDALYGFKDSPRPEGLERQFLHASYVKIQLPACAGRPSGKTGEFTSELPQDLKNVIENLS